MKIIVTHSSPDMDAITSIWLIKKFLPNWSDALAKFVPAGERLAFQKTQKTQKSGKSDNRTIRPASPEPQRGEQSDFPSHSEFSDPIETIGEDEVIHVDTGLGPLDHHQISSDKVCAASLVWDYVRIKSFDSAQDKNSDRTKTRIEAIDRIVQVVVDIDHFKEVFRKDPLADYHEFDLTEILEGLKLEFPNQDNYYVEFVSKCLDAVLHGFENRIWAEKEIAQNGQKFMTRFGKGIGFETINDSVIKLAQKMGYVIAVRKDPRKGYVRIKAVPSFGKTDMDLTLTYEKLKKMDPQATWFLHVSKKMLLNGTVKNPKMRASKLSLSEIIKVLEKV